MKAPKFETENLLLCPLESIDADQIQATFPQWEIVRYLAANFPWPYPEDGAYQYVNNIALPASEKGTAWHWTIRRKEEPNTIIGMILLTEREDDHRGFWLTPKWQGNGYMTEASTIITDFWFNSLNKKVLRAPKAKMNFASKKISEKAGMRLISTSKKQYIAGEFDTELWEITKEEWNEKFSSI
ncbi:GNAT family N-acetyltransferase [Acinetobacter rathckeae]|uniref:GNAT family N-acetyltransferase n=1 Tax=Acinetobacter rathckeae TaxID=2605272 RepID=UPI0018A2C823|nr:GNAT family N-acetyltransferase [Acinetobacter rathckeae]MBF7696494.1 GNAT family N-acetyltransferase [Acinetobacter rathckeae]